MHDPYHVLSVPRHATEAEIRKRYLELVREFSPDRAPERFAEIRKAYDELRDPSLRLKSDLFETETSDSLEAILADVRVRLAQKSSRIPLDLLLSLAESP